jgi:uncharacterized LabA/DUF88 family protein
MLGFYLFMRKAIVFIDGNNWYHNSKKVIDNPSKISFVKISEMVANKFDLDLVEVRYYNSVPDKSYSGYEAHMDFLRGLEDAGVKVFTRELSGRAGYRREKGVDVLIGVDMIKKCLLDEECDVCVLLSGDADFIPVVDLVKERGKEVIVCSVYHGFSKRLRCGEFRYWIFNDLDLGGFLE